MTLEPRTMEPSLNPEDLLRRQLSQSQSQSQSQSHPQPHQPITHQPIPHQPHQPSPLHPLLHAHIPPVPSLPFRSASSTPMSSPGLFSPTGLRHSSALPGSSISESNTPIPASGSPFLHPLQTHKVRETHKALVDSDMTTGRKLINQYEILEEIGRGMHGKVKLARNLENGENVAIKIIPRFSKKRRLGKVMALAKSPADKTMKEIAILKKIRHENVVALLEVIDDPELQKIYMVLEHVELGEIVWRKKGLPHICQYERRRIEREMRGEAPTVEEEKYDQILERRQALKELKRVKMAQNYAGPLDYWSVEYGAADEGSSAGRQSRVPSKEDFSSLDSLSRPTSRAPSRSQSAISLGPAPSELDEEVDWEDDMETPGPLRSNPNSATALEGTMYGAYQDDGGFRGRSPSMADSIISHMSSIDYNLHIHDSFTDDFSYVPCFTFEQARSTFRDTVLGLEYLHYQGVVHRDIKPANLLWNKDHRVKISDFGVSYFGRPIRDEEVHDFIPESEARDFDDDIELAKTVGTPAFFAPEICYTDIDQEQPKVSEQIDVWSLGVTLYCLIYARIPFLAEDEFQMFRKIATEEVYIPRRRLKPVDPATSPAATSLYKRRNTHPYRDDADLEYEDVDNLLYDLLRLMLTKNPEKRIRLRDIKRHPWVVQGIQNPIGWLDDTDPARPSSGRKIQVDAREMSYAVVPLTFLARARSAVKKAVGKVVHPFGDRSESKSRRRATSSAASSAGDSIFNSAPGTPQPYSTERRRSLRPDDYFTGSLVTSPVTDNHWGANAQTESMPYDPLATVLPPTDVWHAHSRSGSADIAKDGSHARVSRATHGQRQADVDVPVIPSTPFFDGRSPHGSDNGSVRGARAMASVQTDNVRSRSVDRGLFARPDKRAHAQVAATNATAPGTIQPPRSPRPMRSIDLSRKGSPGPASPLYFSSGSATRPHGSDPNVHGQHRPFLGERPQTAHRVETVPDAKSPPPRIYNTSNAESFARAKEVNWRKEEREAEFERARPRSAQVDPVNIPCPPSPDDDVWPGAPSRGDTLTTTQSSSTESMGAVGTPLTCPSEVTSPVSAHPPGKSASERMLAFQSDPSLPALLSGASSVSADMEGELLGRPGVVGGHGALLETTDSLTPPALDKEPTGGFPINQVFENPPAMGSDSLSVHYEARGSPAAPPRGFSPRPSYDQDDDDSSDGSDDGILIMAKSRRKKSSPAPTWPRAPLRRDTNQSTASNETAKRIPINGDDSTGNADA